MGYAGGGRDSPGGADGHGLFALAGAEDGERGGAREMMSFGENPNASIGAGREGKGAGEVRWCLI